VRLPPWFFLLLLQSLLASAHYYLYLNACYAYQLILGRFFLPTLGVPVLQHYFNVIGGT
jgi:hypothetical protein